MIACTSMVVFCVVTYAAVFWMQPNHNMTIRETIRIELQPAILTEQLKEK